MQSRNFELFVQDARAVDRSPGGPGIGLALVRHLVQKHNGSIHALSDGPGYRIEICRPCPDEATWRSCEFEG